MPGGSAPPSGAGERPRRSRSSRDDASERSLRSLVTTRGTQVSPTAALRAREVALPTAEDLAAAEQDVVLVRRHYVPPTALTAGRRRDRPDRRAGDREGRPADRSVAPPVDEPGSSPDPPSAGPPSTEPAQDDPTAR